DVPRIVLLFRRTLWPRGGGGGGALARPRAEPAGRGRRASRRPREPGGGPLLRAAARFPARPNPRGRGRPASLRARSHRRGAGGCDLRSPHEEERPRSRGGATVNALEVSGLNVEL